MEKLHGNVQYKDRKDIEIDYFQLDGNTFYYCIGGALSNGNYIASTDLKEAIDPMEPASHIGVIDPECNVVIPFENRKIKTLSDDITDILVVEKAVPTTESVIDANNKKNDPSVATTIVSTQSVIKDKMNTLIGPEGRFACNNPFGEASIFDLNGNNLANGNYYSYIAFGNGKVYMTTNVENAEISEYSVLPPEVQANVGEEVKTEEAIDVNAVAENSEAIAESINTEMEKAAEDITADTIEKEANATVDVTSAIPPVVAEDNAENTVVETEGIAPVEEAVETPVTEEAITPLSEETVAEGATAEVPVDEIKEEAQVNEPIMPSIGLPEVVAEEPTEEVKEEATPEAPIAEEAIMPPEVAESTEEPAAEVQEEVVAEAPIAEEAIMPPEVTENTEEVQEETPVEEEVAEEPAAELSSIFDEPVEEDKSEETTEEVVEEEKEEVTEEPAAEVVEEEKDEVAEEPAAEVVEEEKDEVAEEPAAEVVEEEKEEVTEEPKDDIDLDIDDEIEKPVNLVDLVDDKNEDYYELKEFKADKLSLDDDMNDYGSYEEIDTGVSVIDSLKAGVEKTLEDNNRLRNAVQVVKQKYEDEHQENNRLRSKIEKSNEIIAQYRDNQDILVSKYKELQAELKKTKSQLDGLAELSQLVESRSEGITRTGRRSSGYDLDDIISTGRGRRAA